MNKILIVVFYILMESFVSYCAVFDVTFTGHVYKTAVYNTILPAAGPQTNDQATVHLTYEIDELSYEQYNFGNEWTTSYEEKITDFDVLITRRGQTKLQITNFGTYTNPCNGIYIYNYGVITDNFVRQGATFQLSEPYNQPLPHWRSFIDFNCEYIINEYKDPFVPNPVLDPAFYPNRELAIHTYYWTNPISSNVGYNYYLTLDSWEIRIVPEPATLSLLALGGLALLRKRK